MNDSIDPDIKERQSLIAAAFFGNCPSCAERTLFDGVMIGGGANFAPKCTHCDLDYDAFNVGDGPAAFITFLMGALIVTLALTLELSLQPPFYVHVLLWVPLTIVMTILSLRVAKGALITLEYRNKAKEAVSADVKETVSTDGKEALSADGNDA